MPLAAGTRLGPYEIISLIGQGGMGEVYRARDTKLDREVAIKVLPEEFAKDKERLARFEREAKVLASLNHPNIASIYGLEESDGVKALVLELVEGPTLAERIQEGPIPVEETLAIARQIAEALEAGHESGVIHRDLKPANVKLKEDGTVKVLDYGLAKALEGDTPSGTASELSQSPTLTRHGTEVGVILGTALYMSPEQAKGKRVDKRTDIWAYGVVLYEMLTGREVFHADDVSSTLAKVIERDPDWTRLPHETPAPVLRLIQRALKKDRAQRLPDIGIARLEIDDALGGADESPRASPADAAPRALWQRPAVASTALVLAAAVSGLGVWALMRSRPDAPPSVVRTAIVIPRLQELSSRGWRQIAISPAGTHVVYTANNQLYVRALDALEARPLAGTDSGAADPFFSPDGEWVGFYSHRDRALRKVAVSAGGAVTLAEITPTFGSSWGADDTIVFGQGRSGILRVAADGGTPEVLVPVETPGEASYPQMLPGGGAVLFTLADGSKKRILVERLATGERTVLVEDGREGRYLPTGHLLYALRNTLLAVPFDVDRLEVTGRPVELSEDVGEAAMSPRWTAANAAVSETGVLVYILRNPVSRGERTPVWVGRDGSVETLGTPPRGYVYPHVSPDGTRVSFDVRDEGSDIWIWDLGRKALTRLTFSPFGDQYGLWTADGQRIVFSSNRDGRNNLYWRAANGTGAVERLTESASDQFPHTVSPDGTRLVYRDQRGGGGMDLHVLMLDGSRRSEPLITTEFQAFNAEISPDGRWLAYQSSGSGRHEIYVRPFPDVEGGRWQISTMGGTRPLWAPDGRELFYLTKDGVMGVDVETEAGFESGAPALIVAGSYLGTESVFGPNAFGRTYDISRDGRRFLMIQETREPDDPFLGLMQIVVVQNWFEELKRLVPTE